MANCEVMRRKLVKRSVFNMETGGKIDTGSEWRTEPCGVPIFGEGKICKSCSNGWTHPENYPV
jgi:hypothetical protein